MESHQKLVVGEIERVGTKITVPPEMPLETAMLVIHQKMEYEKLVIERRAEFESHPYEVAHAFGMAIREVCGTLLGKPIQTFFGEEPPQEVSIEVAPDQYVAVLWGRIVFPFNPKNGFFHTGFARKSTGEVIGVCAGQFPQKYQPVWERIISLTGQLLRTESLFRGRTLRVRFTDRDGDALPVADIKAWDVAGMDASHIVFSHELEESIEDHILTPIRHRDECAAAGTPFKRGILLTGPYGTGKTLLAGSVAKEAAQHGITVLYIENVKELPQAIRMAAQLAPAIVFGEDIDRVTDGARDHEIDVLLNTLDGIDTKTLPVMTILTSNYPDKIYKGMVRPGRIDVALNILPPDSEAAQRLVKTYLGSMFNDKNGDLEEMGNALAGLIPAVIREICERSKLSSISRLGTVPTDSSINADDVLRASAGMKNQIALLQAKPEEKQPFRELGESFQRLVDAAEMLDKPAVQELIREYL